MRRGVIWATFALLTSASPPASALWEGAGCAPRAELEQIVEGGLVAGAALGFPDRGSGAPGYSAAILHDRCGFFAWAAGHRRIEGSRPMLVSTRQHIGSLTKPVTAALAVLLADAGALGPDGLESTIDSYLSRDETRALTRGVDSSEPLCPARIHGRNRSTGVFGRVRARCPKLDRITVRHLLNANHGLWDFVSEIDRDGNGFADFTDFLLGDLFDALSIERSRLTAPPRDAFELLVTTGLLSSRRAKIGRNRPRDFELSFGNTGYQLLGVVLERMTGETYDNLVRRLVTDPLGLGRMTLASNVPRNRGGKLATPYAVTSGAAEAGFPSAIDDSLLGVYPLTNVNGHPAIDTFDLAPFLLTNGGGGAGGLSATPRDYAKFFHALITGGLLTAGAQELFDGGFVPVAGEGFEHGFALFRFVTPPLGEVIVKSGQVVGGQCYALHSVEERGGNGTTTVVCRNAVDLFLPNEAAGLGPSSVSVQTMAFELATAAVP